MTGILPLKPKQRFVATCLAMYQCVVSNTSRAQEEQRRQAELEKLQAEEN